jgi:anaerobic magnesium-protoporphyrin IX monomethyl ester cyclase
MSDVLFVYPNILDISVHPEFDRYEKLMAEYAEDRGLIGLARGTLVPPTAMLSLSAFLKLDGISTSFLDLTLECIEGKIISEALFSSLKKEDPGVVAINGMEDCFLNAAYRIAREVKEYNEEIKVIIGGVSATTRDAEVLESSKIDYVIRGEGERTIVSVVNILLRDSGVEKIPGVSYLNKGKVVRTLEREFIDLNDLPFPDRENYPLKRLYAINGGIDLVYGSRGCNCNCSYCNAPTYWQKQWRARPPEDVVEELALLQNMGAKIVHIYDLNFGVDKKWVKEICDGIRKERIDLVWDCELSLKDFSKPFLDTMYSGNCRGAFCGVEASGQPVLDAVNKGYQINNLEDYLKNAKDAGIHVDGGYVFGLPEDTVGGMRKLSELACRLLKEDLVETPATFLFVPFKGTAIGSDPEGYGIEIVNKNISEWHFFSPYPIASTKNASAEDVHREWVNCLRSVNKILEEKLGR